MVPHRWQVCEVCLGSTATTSTPQVAALSSVRRLSSDHACRLIERFNPPFWATFVRGCSRVPAAERSIWRTLKILDRDHVVLTDEAGAGLLGEVLAAVSATGV
jgi:hypothetical protein